MAIKQGDKVKLEYEGSFDNGEIFDSSKHGEHSHPLEFEAGAGMVIPGFDKAVLGMEVGEEKTFKVMPEEGYGEFQEGLRKEIPRNVLPTGQEPEVGMMLMIGSSEGEQFPARIVEVDKEKIVIDLNHPLAGKNLNFKIKIISVN
jgi:FKBP-type peptidyl-prolyl cis-trans isomerase 2